jgi:L-lactate utilization protein LutB
MEMNAIKLWFLKQKIERTLRALKKNGFEATYVATRKEAVQKVLDLIPIDALVGIPGTVTVRQLNLDKALNSRGNQLALHPKESLSDDERRIIHRKQITADVLLTSSNAITETGMLVNTDGVGNRVAAMSFGPKSVVIIAGVNKIVKNLDEAFARINFVAGPMDAKRINRKTPCTVTGVCSNCNSPDRICNVTTIIKKKPILTPITVVLVGEELGY